jgi:uncharacterized membrane protein YcaP (DUF421 family)
MIAEIAVFVIEDPNKPLMSGLLPMIVLVAIQITLSFVHLKSQKMRSLLEGKPSVLIHHGKLDELEMKKQRYNLDDLLQQLREKDIANVADVEYAILENSGKLSVFKKPHLEPTTRADMGVESGSFVFPLPFIMDGELQREHLLKMNKSGRWVEENLRARGVHRVSDVLYGAFANEDGGRWFIQLKNSAETTSQNDASE